MNPIYVLLFVLHFVNPIAGPDRIEAKAEFHSIVTCEDSVTRLKNQYTNDELTIITDCAEIK